VEQYEFILLIVGIIIIPVTALILKGGKRGLKKATKGAVEQIIDVKENVIKDYQKELQRQTGRANRYKQQLDEYEEPEPENGEVEQVRFEDIKALVKKTYPQYSKMLNMPGAKQWIEKQTKNMTLEEVISMVEEWTGKKVGGGQQSESSAGSAENQAGYF